MPCLVCGFEVAPYDGYCTPRHKLEHRYEMRLEKLIRNCVVCNSLFAAKSVVEVACSKDCKLQRNRDQALLNYEKNKRFWNVYFPHCSWCKETYVVVSDSRVASNRQHDECRKLARRSSYRIKTVKRQGVKSQERITHEQVAERDNFLCHICGDVVDMGLPRTSRFGATLDHVIPISRGGKDCLENLRLAHWICNVRKSNKLIEVENA